MAININQHPTSSINASNSDLLYVLSSPSSSNVNYQYVCDIRDDSGELLVRVKQRPNTQGIGVFNLGNIIHSKVNPDDNSVLFDTNEWFAPAVDNLQRYGVLFGEEWASSISSSATLYNGNGVAGSPDVSSSLGDYEYFTSITHDRTYNTNPNFDVLPHYGATSLQEDNANGLTDMPRTSIPINQDDYHTLSLFNGDVNEDSLVYNDIYRVDYLFYSGLDCSGNKIGVETKLNTALNEGFDTAPRGDSGDFYDEDFFFGAGDYKNRLTTIKIGTQGVSIPANAKSYSVLVRTQLGYHQDILCFNLNQEENCLYPTHRLMWLNRYGAWDFYNFDGKNKYSSKRKDHTYKQGFVDYSIPTNNSNPYNRQRRGMKNYHTEISQKVSVSTKFLTEEWANYLEGIFMSSEVFLVDDSGLVPINLTSGDYKRFTDKNTEKLKQYNIEFEYSNPKRPY